MATCKHCGGSAKVSSKAPLPDNVYEFNTLSYADAQKLAWHCDRCNAIHCGKCCFPGFTAMVEETGRSAEQLSREIENSEDGYFEMPRCPDCGASVTDEFGSKGGGGCGAAALLLIILVVLGTLV